MNTTTKSARRPTIVLALPRSAPAHISYAQGVVTRMTGSRLSPLQCPRLPPSRRPSPTCMSVATKSEGPRIKNDEGSGRARSEGRVALFGLAQDVLHDAAIAAETHA